MFHVSKPSAHRSVLLGGVLCLCTTSYAAALEADEFVDTLQQALDTTEASLSYDDADVSGDTITLTTVTLTSPGAAPISLENITFDGVSERPDGGYDVDEASIPDIDVTEDDTRVVVRDLTISGLEIPGAASQDGDGVENIVFYDQARSGPVSVAIDDEEVFALDEFVIDVARKPDAAGFDTMVRGNGVFADLSTVANPEAQQMLEALGYEQLTGSLAMAAGWAVETGEIDVSDFSLSFDDVGTLSLNFNISGYTLDFIETLEETQEAAATGSDGQASGMAMLGLMQQLTFNGATIRFEDDSLTLNAMNYFGQQQGMSGDQVVQTVKGMLPLFLAQLQDPELQAEMNEAIATFLDDPQSLTIAADPADPVPLMAIMGAAMAGPQSLVDSLDVSVMANQ